MAAVSTQKQAMATVSRVLRRASVRRAFSAEPAPAYASERINAATAPTLMEIGCRDIFDEDHDAFRQMVRDFFANEVKPFHAEWEKAGEVPRELWTMAGDLGLLACMVPEAYGGLGTDCRFPAVVWEDLNEFSEVYWSRRAGPALTRMQAQKTA